MLNTLKTTFIKFKFTIITLIVMMICIWLYAFYYVCKKTHQFIYDELSESKTEPLKPHTTCIESTPMAEPVV